MADGERDPKMSRLVEQSRVIHENVQDVQRQPAEAEDKRNADQEQICSMRTRLVLCLTFGQLRLGALEPKTLFQFKIDL